MTSFLSQVAQITPYLYLSGFVSASEQTIRRYDITCIITVCREVPKINISGVESIKLDVLDKPTERLDKYFDYVADKINDVIQRKGKCLVHCVAGISRSATMCIVYLMKYHQLTLKNAYEIVKSKRTFIRPNLGFWSQLVDYEYKLFGKNSIQMLSTNFGFQIPDVYENEFKNMIVPIPTPTPTPTLSSSLSSLQLPSRAIYENNDNVTKSNTVKNISTASITLNNNQIKIPTTQRSSPSIPSTRSLSTLALAAQLENNLTPTQSSPYTTTYSSSYGNIFKR